MPGKLIHHTFSLRRTVRSTIFRIGALGVAVFAFWHVRENPVPITLIFIGGLYFFLIAGDEDISIYEDEVRISGGNLLRTWSGKGRYRFLNVTRIKVAGTFDAQEDWRASIIPALPGPGFGSRTPNKITITLRDGRSVVHQLSVFRSEIDEALGKIPATFASLVVRD